MSAFLVRVCTLRTFVPVVFLRICLSVCWTTSTNGPLNLGTESTKPRSC